MGQKYCVIPNKVAIHHQNIAMYDNITHPYMAVDRARAQAKGEGLQEVYEGGPHFGEQHPVQLRISRFRFQYLQTPESGSDADRRSEMCEVLR